MSFFGTTEFYLEIAKGNVANHEIVTVFGRNGGVGSGAHEDIWTPGGTRTWLTSAVTLEAISSDTDDTAAGTGARTILVNGLDANFLEISEPITMNGTSASTATSQSFIRVNSALVLTTGTYASTTTGGNEGTITIRTSGGGATQAQIDSMGGTGCGLSAQTHYTIPANKRAYLYALLSNVETNKIVTLILYTRPNADVVAAPFSSKLVIAQLDFGAGSVDTDAKLPITIQPKTDIWLSGIVDSGPDADAGILYTMVLEDIS